MAAPLEYMPVDIDMADDPKVFALMEEAGGDDEAARWSAFGRVVALISRVYRHGFYMPYGRFERRKLARDLGMSAQEMDAFVDLCVECEIFDAEMYRERGVLTSRGIQRRYLKAKKVGKWSVPAEDEQYLLDGCPAPAGPQRADEVSENRRDSPRSSEYPRESPGSPENRRDSPSGPCIAPKPSGDAPESAEPSERREDKRRKEKKEKRRERPARAGRDRSSSSANQISGFASRAFPLSCLSSVSDPSGAYFDSGGEAHATPWGALEATWARAAPGQDISSFARQVAGACPPDCDRSLERVEACGRLLQRALRAYDPAKGATPVPLAMRIIADERGGAS